MITKTINISESDLESFNSKSMVLKLIDDQINNYNLQYLKEWEKNHATPSTEVKAKISALKAKKIEINALFDDCAANNTVVDFNISINMRVKPQVNALIS